MKTAPSDLVRLDAIQSAAVEVGPDEVHALEKDYKTCPDCAEEVRFAARKCRFCGYMFAEAPAES